MKKWFNQKERSAGAFRLLILWWIYKFLGKSFLNFIVFFVALISFIFASEIRKYQRKYFKVYSEFYSKELKASLKNLFKHYLSYAYSLADRIEIFSGNLNHKKIIFANENDKIQFKNDFNEEKGIFFICNHLGNVDAMRAFITSDIGHKNLKVNVFMQKNQTQIFNNFIDAIAIKTPICTYPVEEIGVETAIEIQEKLQKGEIVFMAGDRISAQNSSASFLANFLGHNVEFPIGTFRFAQMCNVPIYFISCVKIKNDKYKILLKKFEAENLSKKEMLKKLQKDFILFLEEHIKDYPLQFYHFYDMFS